MEEILLTTLKGSHNLFLKLLISIVIYRNGKSLLFSLILLNSASSAFASQVLGQSRLPPIK
jgi:hypothetical protein